MNSSIFQTLEKLGLTSIQTRVLFNNRTRDIDDLKVWIDKNSGVIYIDDFYVGDKIYVDGPSNWKSNEIKSESNINFERKMDANRRYTDYLNYVNGKALMDFGCGQGDFLKLVKKKCSSVCGLEIQNDCVTYLKSEGIACYKDLSEIPDNSIEVCVSFHVIEHLPEPLTTLEILKKKLVKKGSILIEVPHANDFLMSVMKNNDFKQFTLWSQHLILHTKESLFKILEHVGFSNIKIDGVQRYPISNHLNWLANGKPGGHKTELSSLDKPDLLKSYAKALKSINATDTLVAFAESN